MRYAMVIGVVVALAAGCATTRERRDTAPSTTGEGAGPTPMVQGEMPVTATGFINRTVLEQDGGVAMRYVVYVPQDYTPERAWPMIVFLHGAGERGDDGLVQTEVGIGTAIRRHAERFPAIVVMPQCPAGLFWNVILPEMEAAVARTREEYAVDPERMYLTGLSMGGYGTWLWGGMDTQPWAALMPICGGGSEAEIQHLSSQPIGDTFGNLSDRLERLAEVPIWAFHGADDETVPPQCTKRMVRMVREAGGDVQYTEFPDTGHNSWDKAYGDPKAIRWLLEQRRP